MESQLWSTLDTASGTAGSPFTPTKRDMSGTSPQHLREVPDSTREEVVVGFFSKPRHSEALHLCHVTHQSLPELNSLAISCLGIILNTTSLPQFKQLCPEYQQKYTLNTF